MTEKLIPIVNRIPVSITDIKQVLQRYLQDEEIPDDALLKTYARLKKLTSGFEDTRKLNEVKGRIKDAIDNLKDDTGKVVLEGVSIKAQGGKTFYGYKACGHTEYDFVLKALDILNDRRKEIEIELKTIPDAKVGRDENGETVMIGGNKDIIINTGILNVLTELLETSQFVNGDVITCKKPTKVQDTNIVVRNIK